MFAKVEEVKEGMSLIADGGFTCLHDGDVLTVQKHPELAAANPDLPWLALFVPCSDGRHFLDGQIDDDGFYVGFKLAPEMEIVSEIGARATF